MIKRTAVIILFLMSFAIITKAEDVDASGKDYANELNAIKTTVPFLTIAADSRAGSMGDAGAASSPDLSSQHWNAAKYMFMKDKAGFQVSFTPWLKNLGVDDIYLAYASGYLKFDERQAISASLRFFSLGTINLTNDNADDMGTSTPSEFAIDFGYSRLFSENFSSGMVFRYIRSDIAGGVGGINSPNGMNYSPGNSFAVDLSAYYQKPFELAGKDAEGALGIDISNIGTKMSYSKDDTKAFIPTNLRLGGRFSLDLDEYNSLSIIADMNKLLVPTPPVRDVNDKVIAGKEDNVGTFAGIVQSFGDAPGGGKEELHEISYSLGAEYWYRQQFALRAGYFGEHETKGNRKYFTVGVGLKLNVFHIDFSYLVPAVGGRNNPLDRTYRVSLGFTFK
jgi:hypothetical protein